MGEIFHQLPLPGECQRRIFYKESQYFDVLKLRMSWGNTGNQAIGAYSTLGLLAESKYGWGGTSDYPGYGVSDLPL